MTEETESLILVFKLIMKVSGGDDLTTVDPNYKRKYMCLVIPKAMPRITAR